MQRWGSGLNGWSRRAVVIELEGGSQAPSPLAKERGIVVLMSIGTARIRVCGRAELYCRLKQAALTLRLHVFLSTSISSSTMPTNHPFLKPFSSLKKAITRLRSRMPQSADIASNDLARPSSDPPILMTPSSTIHAVDIAMAVASKMPFNLPAPK